MAAIFSPEYFDQLLRGGQPGATGTSPLLEPPQRPSYVAPRPAPAFGGLPEAPAPSRTGVGYKAGRLVGRGFGALTRLAAPLALGSMAVGMGEKAVSPANENAGAIERGLEIASGADITGFGAWLGNKLTGRGPAPGIVPAANTGVAPEGGVPSPMGAASVTSPAAPPVNPLTGLPEITTPQELQADIQGRSTAAGQLLGTVDTMIGRSGGTTAGANERIRNLTANPAALETFNAAQSLTRAGITASRDAKGQLLLTGDPNARPNFYIGPDGKPVGRYEDSAQYAQGVELAARERVQLGALETKGELADQLARVRRAKTVPGKRLEMELYATMETNQVNRETALRLGAVEGRKAGIEAGKLQLDAIRTMAEAGDKGVKATLQRMTIDAIAKGDVETALLLQGKEPRTDSFSLQPTLSDKEFVRLNKQTGAVVRLTPSSQVRFGQGTDGKFYRMSDDGKLTSVAATPQEEAKLKAR